MEKIKWFISYVFKGIGLFLIFLLNYLFFSWILPSIKLNTHFVEDSQGVEIFAKSNGVHTDIVMPAKSNEINWFEFLPASDFESVDERFAYVSLGWGDKGFYLNTPEWKDLTVSTAVNAAFGLGETAMHVTYFYAAPKKTEKCKSVFISIKQYRVLISLIKSSFELKENKRIAIIHPGYSNYDCFYEANGSYSMFKTCNVWTGNILKNTGVKIGIWTPFQGSIIHNFEN